VFAQTVARPETWTNSVSGLVDPVAFIVGAVGAGVIVWGTYTAVVRLLSTETAAAPGQAVKPAPVNPPLFAAYLLLGLEFIIAANVIKTLTTPDWQHVALLGVVVMVRTLVSLSLRWENAAGWTLRAPAEVSPRLASEEHAATAPFEEPVAAPVGQ